MKLVSNVLTVAILSAFTASAVADVGTLNFNFAGVIPAKQYKPQAGNLLTLQAIYTYLWP